ncbi:MAG: NHLP bacteriocin export ABC transporter permease/ATPase subunit [Fibrobacter sp.]|nr:NHLP bacteriocin export ABC transporter permease/ATPase subunit [Fibrobacter sp.]
MEISLQSGKLYLTSEPTIFTVVEGSALIYIVPIEENAAGRRILLCELSAGEQFPSFCIDSELLGHWSFGISTLEHVKLEGNSASAEDISNANATFAKKIGIRYFDEDSYNEMVVEKYRLNLIKEEGAIYATSEEQRKTTAKSFQIIYDFFEKRENQKLLSSRTGNNLYDAIHSLGIHQGFSIASIDRIRESCGKRFELNDITRISHVTLRPVILEADWFKKDCGSFLGYSSDGEPLAFLCYGHGVYKVCNPATGEISAVTESNAQQILPSAFVFYRPFPNKKIGLRDLILFGLKDIQKRDIFTFALLSLICTCIGMFLPALNQIIFDKVIPLQNKNELIQICFVVLVFAVGSAAFALVKNFAMLRSINTMKISIQSAVFDRLFSLSESFIQKFPSGELTIKALQPVRIFSLLSNGLFRTLLGGIFSVFFFCQMVSISSSLALIGVGLTVLIAVVAVIICHRQIDVERMIIRSGNQGSSWMIQAINGISNIRIANAGNRFILEYLKFYAEQKKMEQKQEWTQNKFNIFINALQIFESICFFYLASHTETLSTGQFLAFVSAFGLFSNAIILCLVEAFSAVTAIPMFDECKVILDELPETSDDTLLPGKIAGDIEVNNVSFSYPGAETPTLKNINLNIREGEYIGIVGSSGSGKSTLLKLLLGFEKPTLGKIYYSKNDIDKIDKKELRKYFGVVLQDDKLISGSIFENITVAHPKTTLDRVQEVIKNVGLEKDIQEMPMGIHTVLSGSCSTISGGQQQRIQIARAIVGKPKVLFFDEATSALDNQTQAIVGENLSKMKCTKIVVAHRLSTVIHCDRIIVVNKGEIVESGSYEELMGKKGFFYDLSSRQNL